MVKFAHCQGGAENISDSTQRTKRDCSHGHRLGTLHVTSHCITRPLVQSGKGPHCSRSICKSETIFSRSLGNDGRELLGENSKKQIIFEAETLCAVVAHLLWSEVLQDKKSFLYVDNEGTKFRLIKRASENEVVDSLARTLRNMRQRFVPFAGYPVSVHTAILQMHLLEETIRDCFNWVLKTFQL